MSDETSKKVFRLSDGDGFEGLIHVITVLRSGRLYDDMFFPDGAHHGGGYVDRWDDSSWVHNMNDYDLGFHEDYEGTHPDPKMLADIQLLPEMTGAQLWVHIKNDRSVLESNKKARELNGIRGH